MIAYKGFNEDMTCTLGKGSFKYEIGKIYTEAEAKCASTGFHCVEEPIEVLRWYPKGRYCIVNAGGDINEDGNDKIACTQIEIIREVDLVELAVRQCLWMQDHPEREYSKYVQRDYGSAGENDVVVVRGKNPKARGCTGATLFLLKEKGSSHEIDKIGAYRVDGEEVLPGVDYQVDGRRVE